MYSWEEKMIKDRPGKNQKGGEQKEQVNDTATSELENKLRKIFNDAEQSGGKRRKKSKKVDVVEDGVKKKSKKKSKKKKIY